MKTIFRLLILVFPICISIAQNDGREIADNALPLSNVELVNMPALENALLRKNELRDRGKGRPPRFAFGTDVNIRPSSHGNWECLPNGNWLWRLRIRSSGAFSLNLGFMEYYMPRNGKMLLYSIDKSEVIGPFSMSDNENHLQLWSPLVPGDEVVIEVQLPFEERNNLRLWLTDVNHDFAGLGRYYESGSCNLDVICGSMEGWNLVEQYRDIIQSVGIYTLGGEVICSGFLVNNVRQDCTPYFITADHCNVKASNAPSMVVYWNYENQSCRPINSSQNYGLGNGVLDGNSANRGAIFRASYAPSDMALVELDDPVKERAHAFFAGWSVNPTPPEDTTICIHHPNTQEKRISFDFDATYIGSFPGPFQVPNGDHIIIADWDIGTTESGSSGAPLFDKNKRVVGQVHGGAANCSNNAYDSFGWFYTSWEGGRTKSTSLKEWLDPDDTGTLNLDGRWNEDCVFFVETVNHRDEICIPDPAKYLLRVSENFTGPVYLSAEDLPYQGQAVFSVNPVLPGDTTSFLITNTPSILEGSYEFSVRGNDGVHSTSLDLSLLAIKAPPQGIEPFSPLNANGNEVLSPSFAWSKVFGGISYDLEISLNDSFGLPLFSFFGLREAHFNGIELEPGTTYYWRVRGENICGKGPWTPWSTFSTAENRCEPIFYNRPPVEIPNSYSEKISATIFNESGGKINEISIPELSIQHTYIGDLSAWLTSPEGTQITLFDRPGVPNQNFGCGGDDLFLSFSDTASQTADILENSCNTKPAISGSFQPIDSFSAFIGENAFGQWTLTVIDHLNQDGGFLLEWGINFCLTAEPSLPTSANNYDNCGGNIGCKIIVFPNPTSDKVFLSAPVPIPESLQLTMYNSKGQRLFSDLWTEKNIEKVINLNSFPSGVYILQIHNSQTNISKKIIIN